MNLTALHPAPFGDDVGGCDVLRMPGTSGKQQAAHVAAAGMEGECDCLGGFEK